MRNNALTSPVVAPGRRRNFWHSALRNPHQHPGFEHGHQAVPAVKGRPPSSGRRQFQPLLRLSGQTECSVNISKSYSMLIMQRSKVSLRIPVRDRANMLLVAFLDACGVHRGGVHAVNPPFQATYCTQLFPRACRCDVVKRLGSGFAAINSTQTRQNRETPDPRTDPT